VILAFRHPTPPLPFLLAAFYMRDSLDFGFVPTRWDMGSGLSLGGAKLHHGDKQLLVFKESFTPFTVKHVSCKGGKSILMIFLSFL